MDKEIKQTIVNYTVDSLEDIIIDSVIQDKNSNHKGLKFSINQESISTDEGTKAIGLFYDVDNNFQFKIENYYDTKDFEIKTIEYNSNNDVIRIVEYDNYPNGEAKWIKSYDKDGNVLSEDFYDEDFWDD